MVEFENFLQLTPPSVVYKHTFNPNKFLKYKISKYIVNHMTVDPITRSYLTYTIRSCFPRRRPYHTINKHMFSMDSVKDILLLTTGEGISIYRAEPRLSLEEYSRIKMAFLRIKKYANI